MISLDGFQYVWIRIDAYIYYSGEDKSVRMFTYRKNIDDKKEISFRAEMDELTMVYNKTTTERRIREALS